MKCHCANSVAAAAPSSCNEASFYRLPCEVLSGHDVKNTIPRCPLLRFVASAVRSSVLRRAEVMSVRGNWNVSGSALVASQDVIGTLPAGPSE